MLISVGSVKGSPGATTLAALLADRWPTALGDDPGGEIVRSVLVEADPDGGVLGARWLETLGVTLTPGLVEVASQCRGSGSMTKAVQALAQPATCNLDVVPGLPSRVAMASTLSGLSDQSLAELARWDRLVVADVGRYSALTLPLVRRSQLSLVVAEPSLESAQLLQSVVADIAKAGGRVGLMTLGDSPYSPADLAAAVSIESDLVWSVPVDGRAARLVNSGGPTARGVRRSQLGRAVRGIAADIANKTGLVNVADKPPVGSESDRKVRDAMAETDVTSTSFGEVASRG